MIYRLRLSKYYEYMHILFDCIVFNLSSAWPYFMGIFFLFDTQKIFWLSFDKKKSTPEHRNEETGQWKTADCLQQ